MKFALSFRVRLWLGMLVALVVLASAVRLWPRAPLSSHISSSQAYLATGGEVLRLTLASDDQYRVWTALNDINPDFIKAVLLYEDRWFYWHPGVNPSAIMRAIVRTYGYGQNQGGSTISMQLARLYYGLNTKSPVGKIEQMALALWLELRYSKTQILEAYLNLAPYGNNIQGVGAASLIYLGKLPKHLSISESLSLAVIPQQPNRRAGTKAFELEINAPKQRLLTRWKTYYPLDELQTRLAQLPVPFHKLQDVPFRAPHFVDMLEKQNIKGSKIQTTLDLKLQNLLERETRQYIQEKHNSGIHNAVALLIDKQTLDVKAWLGSADYFDTGIDGQVNGVLAKRSPGSTLKPFIYALAMDQGILHPATILKDAPTDFGSFTPENFDGKFRGPITAQDALIHSRNIPAVWVASQLHNPSLYDFLVMSGITELRSESYYGLALVLGGGEVSMEELTSLYAMLAQGGRYQNLHYLRGELRKPGPLLLSPEAAFITLDMLSHNPRQGIDENYNVKTGWNAAWKTGTSWGFRDAWSVGVVGPYVLAVWIGNFDGSDNPAFVGIDAAAPLFFRLADGLYLHKPESVAMPKPPAGVSRVEVCAASGDLPNAWCPQKKSTWYIPGKSPIKVSQLHQPVAFDIRTQEPVCPPYKPENVRIEVMEFWSSEMQKIFNRAGLPRRVPPKCNEGFHSEPPTIMSPSTQISYELRINRPEANIPLQANAAAQVKTLYWFDGNRFVGRSEPQSALPYRPAESGIHNIRVVDDQGQWAERDVKVDWLN